MSNQKIWTVLREWTESINVPEVEVFTSYEAARTRMIDWVFTAATGDEDRYVSDEIDGEPITRIDVPLDVTRLNLQWPDGGVCCFFLKGHDIEN